MTMPDDANEATLIDLAEHRIIPSHEAVELLNFLMTLSLLEARFVKTYVLEFRERKQNGRSAESV
jgi:hypothetical protein